MPSETRPQRPERWLAEAWETRSMGSRWTLVRCEYREMRAVPGSMTYLMPGTVSEVSATLVASTIRRLLPGREDGVLLGKREPGEQRQDLGVPQPRIGLDPAAQRLGRVADFALAGEEDQHVSGRLAGQLVDGVAHRVQRVPVLFERVVGVPAVVVVRAGSRRR